MSSEPDVVIIGAGAAGLAAARTLLAADVSIAVLEAKERIGGRAFTDNESVGIAWDQGGHWLHDQGRNFFARYAQDQGIPLEGVAETMHIWTVRGWADSGFIRDYDAYCDLVFDRIQCLGLGAHDVSVADATPVHFQFQPMFASWYAALSGMEPDRSSAFDDYRYQDDTGNRRVRCGYGALLADYGREVPVTLATPVEHIDWSGPLSVHTPKGELRPQAVIVTVSHSVLSAETIRFSPRLPEAYMTAFANIPLGEAEKVAIAFEGDVFGMEDEHVAFVHEDEAAVRFQIRPFAQNIAIAYMAGRFARYICDAGEAEMAAFALERLADAFGTDIRSRVTGVKATQWCRDPHIGGGYSSARPGQADGRYDIAHPLAERLYFAGEAHAVDAYGTVHGAYRSGVETAGRVVTALGR